MGCCASSTAGPASDPATGQTSAKPVQQSAPQQSKNPLAFANKLSKAVGDANIAPGRRVTFGIVYPAETGVRSLHMFFDKAKPVELIIAGAASQGGLKLDKGKLIGSPQKLNLFTLEGDIVRLDLEIEAHLGSTLHDGDVLILEKGNRLDDAFLRSVKAATGR